MAAELQEYRARVLTDPIRSNNQTQFLVRIDGKDYQVIEDGIHSEPDYLFRCEGTVLACKAEISDTIRLYERIIILYNAYIGDTAWKTSLRASKTETRTHIQNCTRRPSVWSCITYIDSGSI